MPPTERTFDRSALIRAWLSHREYRNAHVDLKSYHELALAAFSKAFGIDLDTPPANKEGFPDENGLHGLFLQVVHAYENTVSPFSGYLEASKEISAVYQKYGESLTMAARSQRALHLKMMEDLVAQIWRVEESRQVSRQELEVCDHPGWDPPEPDDYW